MTVIEKKNGNTKLLILWMNENNRLVNNDTDIIRCSTQQEVCAYLKTDGDGYRHILCTRCMPLYISSVYNMRVI
jgi:hypothetical protein